MGVDGAECEYTSSLPMLVYSLGLLMTDYW